MNAALCEGKTARFKGLITPAIRLGAARTLSLAHYMVNIHGRRERERMMDGGRRKEPRRGNRVFKSMIEK